VSTANFRHIGKNGCSSRAETVGDVILKEIIRKKNFIVEITLFPEPRHLRAQSFASFVKTDSGVSLSLSLSLSTFLFPFFFFFYIGSSNSSVEMPETLTGKFLISEVELEELCSLQDSRLSHL